jgi:hypothetical protein
MSANPYERDLRKVSDPLAEETRRLRKALLVWCLVAAAITVGGLFPSEITALGLKVTPTNRSVLAFLLAAVLGYHLVAFVSYATADFARWYVNHRSTEWEDDVANYEKYKAELLATAKLSEEDRNFMQEHERRLGSLWRGEALTNYLRVERAIPYISAIRAIVDFALPLISGVVGMWLLVRLGLSAA